ncbi:hypothetical protein [Streptomyces sp. MUSC 14]|uniref:hypothetical protein n=1 Tax=Streptomyces sp. MUSC 14 TaxID=1354889 RepID=UPI000A664DF5|nr:hypothetical protein [Streptomyces sp. MUSC 14]
MPAAQDAVNAALGCLPRHSPNYCLVDVKATLGLPSAAQELLAQRAADEQRVRRLRFLKENLYDHPDLVVLDQLEHHAPGDLGDEHAAELQRLARLICSCDRWWFPLLHSNGSRSAKGSRTSRSGSKPWSCCPTPSRH